MAETVAVLGVLIVVVPACLFMVALIVQALVERWK